MGYRGGITIGGSAALGTSNGASGIPVGGVGGVGGFGAPGGSPGGGPDGNLALGAAAQPASARAKQMTAALRIMRIVPGKVCADVINAKPACGQCKACLFPALAKRGF